jgi:hypothetical protein
MSSKAPIPAGLSMMCEYKPGDIQETSVQLNRNGGIDVGLVIKSL